MTEEVPKVTEFCEKISNDYDIKHDLGGKLSSYEKILCLYTIPFQTSCTDEIKPLSYVDKQTSTIGKEFNDFYINSFQRYAVPIENKFSKFEPALKIYTLNGDKATPFTHLDPDIDIIVLELKKPNENQIRGMVCTVEDDNVEDHDFFDWFCYHLLEVSKLNAHDSVNKELDIIPNKYHLQIANFFNENLKNIHKDDMWDEEGSFHFANKLKYFTKRLLPVQAILPAFPCKSTNLQKVAGDKPDRGEVLALRTLIQFCKEIKAHVYPPGFKIWIVSDGHVFSDCIGADDNIIDEYGKQLRELYESIKEENQDEEDYIGFFGLKEVFYSENSGEIFDIKWLQGMKLPHYTNSQIDLFSETCRKIMMAACDSDNGRLRQQVNIPDHPRLLLYRGFTRFMEEDICRLEVIKELSRKQQKKVAAKIAFEMIKRNDAYSNLVDLVFPHHMRFSIHAHINSGPKYGIKIVPSEICKSIKSMNELISPDFEDFLHIPTPWHNCVIRYADQKKLFFGRSSIVAEAVMSKAYIAKMVEDKYESILYEIRDRGIYEKCEYDDVCGVDEILSGLRAEYLKKKAIGDMKEYVYISDMDAESVENLLDVEDVTMTSRSSIEKSATAILEAEGNHSLKNMQSITPYTNDIIDDVDLKTQIHKMSLEEGENKLLE